MPLANKRSGCENLIACTGKKSGGDAYSSIAIFTATILQPKPTCCLPSVYYTSGIEKPRDFSLTPYHFRTCPACACLRRQLIAKRTPERVTEFKRSYIRQGAAPLNPQPNSRSRRCATPLDFMIRWADGCHAAHGSSALRPSEQIQVTKGKF
jgi:hypothetical protein